MKILLPLTIFFVLLLNQVLDAQNKIYSDSLMVAYENCKSDTCRARILKILPNALKKMDCEKSLEFALKAVELAKKRKNSNDLNDGLFNVCFSAMLCNKFHIAIDYCTECLNNKLDIDKLKPKDSINNKELASIYNLLGIVHDKQGIYDDALVNYFKSLEISEELDDKKLITNTLSNIGLVYGKKNDFVNARKYFDKAEKIFVELNDEYGLSIVYNNLGLVYRELKDFNKSLAYQLKSLTIKHKFNDLDGLSISYNNIALLYVNLSQFDSAIFNLDKALKFSKIRNNKYHIASALQSYGYCYLQKKEYHKAIFFLDTAYRIFENLKTFEKTGKIAELLSTVYENIKDYKKALYYHQIFKKSADSIFNKSTNDRILHTQMQYEFDKLQKIKLIEQQKKDEISEKEIEKQKILFYSSLAASMFLLLALLVILLAFRNKKRLFRILSLQKEEILRKNKELLQQKEEIIAQANFLNQANEELQKLSIVASKTGNAVMILDADGNFEWVNDGFAKLYGYNFSELVAHKGKNILESSFYSDFKNLFDVCCSEKISVTYESNPKTKDGTEIWVQTTLTPVINAQGIVEKLVAIDTDIRKLIQSEKEIKHKNEEIEIQRDELQRKNRTIQEQNDLITGSIRYAQTIQQAMMPLESTMKRYFDYFLIFFPKDIVSGDFYWFTEVKNSVILALVDCTGHGVPGAFMSMIGNVLLNNLVIERQILTPSLILENLHQQIVLALHQSHTENTEGMDIAVVKIKKSVNSEYLIEYAGAKQNFYYFEKSSEKIVTLLADRRTVGGVYAKSAKYSFRNHTAVLSPDDIIYLFTDGITDQNNADRKRFSSNRLLKIIESNAGQSFEEQRYTIISNYEHWIQNQPQRDDITILGFKPVF